MPDIFQNYTACILDLDNTLYPEIQYLQAAWQEMGKFISEKSDISAEEIAADLEQDFIHSGRENLLNRFILKYKLEESLLPELLKILRLVQVPGGLFLYPEYAGWKKNIQVHPCQIFVVTNGNISQQQNKIRQIHWNNVIVKEFIYANSFMYNKPSPEAFLFVADKYNLKESEILCVGDSETDAQAAEAAGMNFMYADIFREKLIHG